jgi:hypothetical protein
MTQLQVFRRSALEDSDCLYRFNEVHQKGVDDSSDYALRGQAFAHIKHLYILALVAGKTPQDQDLAQRAFVQGIAEHQTPQRLIPELNELWTRHSEAFALDLERYVTSEERQVGEAVSFTPDLVYAHPTELEVVDDKTYWVTLTEADVKETYQARFYGWQAMQRWPNFPSYRITFYFVRFNRTTSVVFTKAEIEQMEIEVQADIARVKHAQTTNSYPAVVGPACRYCELKCPMADREMVLPVRFTAEQATQIGQLLVPAEKKMKAVKKAFKQHCVANGPVQVGRDTIWGNWPVTERKYPLDVVLRTLAQRNIMGAFEKEGLTVSHSALSKLFKQFPALSDDLREFCQEKTTYRFSLKKVDPNEKPFGDGEGDE